MFNRNVWGMAVCVGLSALAFGADTPTTKPAAVKLVKPWSTLSSLTDDQKEKIHDIHEKANEEKKAIDDKEKSDIMALLSDDQKAELKKNHEADLADTKMKKAEKPNETQNNGH